MVLLHSLLLTPRHRASGNGGRINQRRVIIGLLTASKSHHTFIVVCILCKLLNSSSDHRDILPSSRTRTRHELLLLLRLLGLTQLLQTLLIEEPNLVEELLAPLLEYLLLLLLFILGRGPCSIVTLSVEWNLEADLLPFLDLIETKRKVIRHDFEAAKQLHIEFLYVSWHLDMAMDHDLQLAHQALFVHLELQGLAHTVVKMT